VVIVYSVYHCTSCLQNKCYQSISLVVYFCIIDNVFAAIEFYMVKKGIYHSCCWFWYCIL